MECGNSGTRGKAALEYSKALQRQPSTTSNLPAEHKATLVQRRGGVVVTGLTDFVLKFHVFRPARCSALPNQDFYIYNPSFSLSFHSVPRLGSPRKFLSTDKLCHDPPTTEKREKPFLEQHRRLARGESSRLVVWTERARRKQPPQSSLRHRLP